MTNQTMTNTGDILFVGHLALERCRLNLAHIHALLHICDDKDKEPRSGQASREALETLLDNIDRDLKHSQQALEKLQAVTEG